MEKMTELYLISGFLGSGKTTLVKRLLEETSSAKIGVIMNEFGKVSIDGPIIKREGMELIELTRGSIFCSCLTMAFAEALIEMAGKGLDYLIVESSGLADPSNIGEILNLVGEQLEKPYVYSGSMTVVDASRFLEERDTVATIVKQIQCSDLTWLNKVDLVDDGTLETVKSEIVRINPETEVRCSTFFKEVHAVLGTDLSKGKFPELRVSLNTPENKPKTMTLQYDGEVTKVELQNFMGAVMTSAFRMKGFVQIENRWWEVHGVGDCIDFYETDRHLETSTLVIISKIGPQIIRTVDSAWKDHVGQPMKMING